MRGGVRCAGGEATGARMSRGPHIKEDVALSLLSRKIALEDAAQVLGVLPANLQVWARKRERKFKRRSEFEKSLK